MALLENARLRRQRSARTLQWVAAMSTRNLFRYLSAVLLVGSLQACTVTGIRADVVYRLDVAPHRWAS